MKELKQLEKNYKEIINNAKILYKQNVINILKDQKVHFNHIWFNPFDEEFKEQLDGFITKIDFNDDNEIWVWIKSNKDTFHIPIKQIIRINYEIE